jgi:probable HAF family extracellular repeat protein
VTDMGATVGWYFDGSRHDIPNGSVPTFIAGNYVVGNNQAGSVGNAFVYTLGRTSSPIPYLSGDTTAIAYGVTSTGTVVGESDNGSTFHAFVYSGGVTTDLSTLVSGTNPFSSLSVASAISSDGKYIVGYGTVGTQNHGFLLTAVVPEPSTLLLAATAVIGLLIYAWRNRK